LLQDLLSGQFNVTLGEKLSEHLKKWIDVNNILQPTQPVRLLNCMIMNEKSLVVSCSYFDVVLTHVLGIMGTWHRVRGGRRHAGHFS
jgi:hypothetical protein